MLKHFYPDRRGLIQDNPAPFMEPHNFFKESANDINNVLSVSSSRYEPSRTPVGDFGVTALLPTDETYFRRLAVITAVQFLR